MAEEKKAPADKPADKPAKGAAPKGSAPKGGAPKDAPAEKPADAPKAEHKSTRKTVAKEDRKFVSSSTGEAVENAQMGHAAHTQGADIPADHEARKAQAQPFRIAAIVLWVLGIVAEVLCIVFLKMGKTMPFIVAPIVVDFVLVVIGSQLWKKANHIDPPAKAEGALYWVKTELGLVVAVVAFFPIVILLLLDKNSDPKTKGIATAVAVVALIIAGASGVDYHPQTQEALDEQANQEAIANDEGQCYWTAAGSVYHFDPDCSHLLHSAEIKVGTVQQALDDGMERGCKSCTTAQDSASAGDATQADEADQADDNAQAEKESDDNVIDINQGSDSSNSEADEEETKQAA